MNDELMETTARLESELDRVRAERDEANRAALDRYGMIERIGKDRDRLAAQLATLRAALEPLMDGCERITGARQVQEWCKAARAALSQTEPSEPPKGDGLACRHCDDRACTFSTPRCETAQREMQRAREAGMPPSGRHG